MNQYRLLPRLLWALLISQLAVLMPYFNFTRFPLWVYFLFGVCALWRLMVAYGYWILPKTRYVYSVGILSGFIVLLELGLNREAALALLAVAFCLKLLELKAHRDSMIILFLGYFLLAIVFLHMSSFWGFCYFFAAFILLTMVFIGLNRIGDIVPIGRVLQKTFILTLQAIPFVAVSFLLFSRISIPFWNGPNKLEREVSGFSQTVEPGSISRLAQSDKIVLRVIFFKKTPLQKDLYWRGLVLSLFDGKRWSIEKIRDTHDKQIFSSNQNDIFSYQVFLEPTYTSWLFALEKPLAVTGESFITSERTLEARSPVNETLVYQGRSALHINNIENLSSYEIKTFTQLPDHLNPGSKAFAQKLFLAASTNPKSYIAAVLDHFRHQGYVYTLESMSSPEHIVDDFLFKTRKGFCEHYATAFAVLMRAVHIPARVVVGYQGGEWNPLGNYWMVRQYHAHAWVEVWLPNEGWIRVDPVEAVAPHRIEAGIMAEFSPIVWGIDALKMFWQQTANSFGWMPFVVAFMILMGILFMVLGFVQFPFWSRDKPKDPIRQAYFLFCRKLAKMGMVRKSEEGPETFAKRAIQARPDLKKTIEEIHRLYVKLQYRNLIQNKQDIQFFCGKIKQLKLE